MEKGVNIHLPPLSVNLRDDAWNEVVERLDVFVEQRKLFGSSSYGASEPTRMKCREIVS